ncbi:hypothetical protein GF412_03115 [Candidatus Micrarchaeota archaeon]|nr:hypothetical protein [Candidatus Micrarchaeota archaeon]MBD3417943.1 hypothetical protein [Candidatus Micrarchaeota archaeon]
MKEGTAFLLAVVLLLAGCPQETSPEIPAPEPQPEAPPEEPPATEFSIGYFSFEHPDWEDALPQDKNTFLLKTGEGCAFSAGEYPLSSRILRQELEKQFGAEFSGEYIEYTINAEGTSYNAITRAIYCDYKTYTLSLMCIDEPDSSLLSSAECKKREPDIKPGLGLMPIPANDSSELILPAFREARENGADILSWYFFWGPLENNLTVADHIMEPLSYEGKTAVLMNIIYSNVLGEFPERYESFDEPGFKEDFADFSVDFVKRYSPDYYFIGGEVDIYLNMHREQLPAFKELLSHTYERIKEESPETQVGTVVTYHYAKDYNATDIIQELAPECDLIGYTVHPYEGRYNYSNVSRGTEYLEELPEVVQGKPYAILETGWSSSPLLGSSEEKQDQFLEEFFSHYENSDAEFMIWFSLHEWSDCREHSERYTKDLPEIEKKEEYLERFREFLCSLGLKNPDRSPKKAWATWKEYTGAQK